MPQKPNVLTRNNLNNHFNTYPGNVQIV